jgi:hypothetical protein
MRHVHEINHKKITDGFETYTIFLQLLTCFLSHGYNISSNPLLLRHC